MEQTTKVNAAWYIFMTSLDHEFIVRNVLRLGPSRDRYVEGTGSRGPETWSGTKLHEVTIGQVCQQAKPFSAIIAYWAMETELKVHPQPDAQKRSLLWIDLETYYHSRISLSDAGHM